MTKTLYAATSRYVEEINNLPVKRQVSVSGILKKLDVSRSGYNAWKKRVPSDTSIRRTVLKEKIQKIYDDSHQNYGAPKIAAELLQSKTFTINKSDFERVINGDIYGRSFAKYLLLKLDLIYRGSSTPMIPQAIASIEHILPRNPSADSQWVKDFSAAEREEWTNKLGNLVLISRRKNTSQGNRDYVEKKEKYFEKNIEMFPNSIRIYQNYPEWKLSDLKKNHSDVVTELLNVY